MATLTLKKSYLQPHESRTARARQALLAAQAEEERCKQADKRERKRRVRAWLQTFPAFQLVVPLQIGIRRILLTQLPEDISSRTLARALRRWTTQNQYLQALAGGGKRYGLYGEFAGEVSKEHQTEAARRLHERVIQVTS